MGILLWLGLIGLAVWLWWEVFGGKWRLLYNLPPGPTPLPLLGNLLSVDPAAPWETIQAMARKYGKVFTLWLGPTPSIVVTDLSLIKSTFQGESGKKYTQRPYNAIVVDLSQGNHGMGNANGRLWMKQRSFVLAQMREFGMGSTDAGLVKLISDCIEEMLTFVGKKVEAGGGAAEVNLLDEIALLASNIIMSVMAGKTWARGAPEFEAFQTAIYKTAQSWETPSAFLFNCWPILASIPGLNRLLGWGQIEAVNAEYRAFYRKTVEQGRREWDGKDQSCILYRMFAEQRRREAEGDEPELFSEINIRTSFGDIVSGGADASRKTLGFAFIYMLRNPEVEAACQREIEEAIGRERPVVMADREDLPYVQATIYECQRLANVLAVNCFHTTLERGEKIGEWDVPPGCPIHPEISAVMMDPQHFPDPETFRPERFLRKSAASGGALEAFIPEPLLPYGIGGRRCPGEELGKVQLFLIFANVLQRFRLRCVDPANPPSAKPIMGITLYPRPYTLIMAKAKSSK